MGMRQSLADVLNREVATGCAHACDVVRTAAFQSLPREQSLASTRLIGGGLNDPEGLMVNMMTPFREVDQVPPPAADDRVGRR